jgi:hypothetical protein
VADKEKSLYTRGPRGFEPANELAEEFWRACKIGDMVELKGSHPRNLIFHRLWWVMLNDMARNANPATTPGRLNFMAKVGTQTGEWEKVPSRKLGKAVPIFVPGSISFAAMDETEFRRFVQEAATFLCENFLPGVVPDHFIREFEQLAIGR